jgi:hypothetical protein
MILMTVSSTTAVADVKVLGFKCKTAFDAPCREAAIVGSIGASLEISKELGCKKAWKSCQTHAEAHNKIVRTLSASGDAAKIPAALSEMKTHAKKTSACLRASTHFDQECEKSVLTIEAYN